MPTRLLLDGEDLAGLMHRVRTEMGPGAVVVKAERVRTGGIAGFFAKEHFELTVEVPEPPRARIPRRSPLPVPAPSPAAAAGLSALLEAADAAEVREQAGRVGALANEAAPVAHQVLAEPAVLAVPAVLGAPAASAAGPRVSTDADTFASLLASIDDMSAAPTDAPVPPAAPTAAEPAGAAVAARVQHQARFAARGAVVRPMNFGPIHRGATADVGAPAPVPAPLPRAGGGDRRALLALGVPAGLLGEGPLDEPLTLSELLANLGRPPTLLRTPGAIVAVVGDSAQALAVATQMALRLGLDPHEVALAGEMEAVAGHGRRLLSPAAAARHRVRIADGGQVSIVAVGVALAPEDWPTAAQFLAELGPDQAWAVVDARRKPADLLAWLRAVGRTRPFDVVAASGVHETQEPGTVLGLGLPVGWIDGLPTTPVVWAAVLSERLDAGARWD